jgi:hypothetical protein
MTKKIKAIFGTPSDIEGFAVELYVEDGNGWAQIDKESGSLEIEICTYPDSPPLRFSLDELEKVLALSREKLNEAVVFDMDKYFSEQSEAQKNE